MWNGSRAAVRIYITAQEILVDNASYPTKDIAEKFAHLPHARAGLCQISARSS